MMKFKQSSSSVMNDLLLWQTKPTESSIKEVYDLKVHPVASFYNEGTINFDIPPQAKGLLSNVDIITKFKVKKGAVNLSNENQCSIVNNFANSLWDLVDVKISDRVDLMQSMRNSYAYQSFFNIVLNSDKNREDYLYTEQLFMMDSSKTKADSETAIFTAEDADTILNKAAAERAKRIAESKSVTVSSKLFCPLFNSSKSLPSNLNIRLSLSKNSDKFLLIADANDYKVEIEDVYLMVKFARPHDFILEMMEDRLSIEPAHYFVTRPDIIIKPIAQSGRIVRLNNLFQGGKLPSHAFFMIQRSADFDGSFDSNPFAFVPFGKFQLHIDGVPYFSEPLEMMHSTENKQKLYSDNRSFLTQLYKTIGKDMRGCGLITSTNFQQNFMVGVSLTPDRRNTMSTYLSPQIVGSTHLEIDFGYDVNITEDLILIIYACFDRVIQISGTREIEIIE